MKKSAITAYLLVLVASLALAYYTWTAEKKERPGTSVSILDCAARDITSILIESKKRTIEYSPRKSRVTGEPYWWVRITSEPFVPPAKETTKESAVPEGDAQKATADKSRKESPETPSPQGPTDKEEKPRIEEFKGNKSLGEQIVKFCPLQALRSFGTLGEDKLKEFGLADSEDRLVIGLKEGTREFIFGTTSYGKRDRYLKDGKTGTVYLVSGQLIQDLTYPKSRFMERALHTFDKNDVVRLQISTGEMQKELVHTRQEETKKDVWADSKEPDKEVELYGNWVNKLFQLNPVDYLPMGESSDQGCTAPQGATYECSMLFFSDARELGFLKVYKGKDDKGEAEYYACSDNSEAVVKLSKSQAENFVKDLDDILGKP